MDRVHRMDLVYEFFFVFSRFEYALSLANYLTKGKAVADWDRFAREMNKVFNVRLAPEVTEAVQYYEKAPPKKQVVESENLTWQDEVPGSAFQLEKLLLLVRRVRNNLFHGEKLGVLLEGDSERDTQLLKHGLTILYASLNASADVRKKFFSGEWQIEDEELETADIAK